LLSANHKIWHKLSRNALSNLAGAIAPMLVGFFLLPFVIRHIGAVAYGIWMITGSAIGYMGLINLGLGPTVTKKSAEYIALKDHVGLNKMLSTVFVLYLCLGLIIGILIFLAAPFIPKFFQTNSEDIGKFETVLYIVGLQAAFGFPFAILGGLIQGLQDFHVNNGIIVLNSTLRLVATILLLTIGFGLISLLWLEFALSAIGWVLQIAWVKKRIPWLKLTIKLFDAKQLNSLFRFSGAMFIWRIAGMTVLRSHRIIIGLFLPLSHVTVFEVGNRIIEYSRMVCMSFLGPLLPASSELGALNASSSIRAVYLRGTKIVLSSYLAASIALFFWGEAFVRLWVGQEFLPSVTIMQVLLLGNVYSAQSVVAHFLLAGTARLRIFTRVMIAYPILCIMFSVILINVVGLIGVAIGITLTFFILETYFLRKILEMFKVSLVELLRTCHVPALFTVIPCLSFAILLSQLHSVVSWLELIAACAIFFMIFIMTFWLVGLNQRERSLVATLIKNAMATSKKPGEDVNQGSA
jgi:O-antigen/teichoic acid export membrane protein